MNITIFPIERFLCKLPVLLSVLLLATAMSYGQSTSERESSLIGSWTFVQEPSFVRMTAEDKGLLDSSPQLKAQILTSYVNRTLAFGPDGSFSQTDGTGKRVEGTWDLQGETLTIRSLKGNIWVQQVALLDQDQLVLRQVARGEAQPMLPELHFTKNQ